MKKLVFILSCVLCSCSCTHKSYKVKYKVYYPGKAVEKTVVVNGMRPRVKSYRGSNSLFGGAGIILETTAPIELISVEEIN